MAKILVVDDEEKICFAFETFLTGCGHTAFIASNAEDAMRIIETEAPRIVFLDIRLPGQNGLALLQEISRSGIATRVVIMTAYGTMDTAVEAMQHGACEYLVKPIDLDRTRELIDDILLPKDVSRICPSEDAALPAGSIDATLVGNSRCIQDIYKMIGLLTTHDVPVLIEGESGVGKELVARAIHFKSARRLSPFVAINCGAMPESLLETELFGHEKGAFTGADCRKIGKFEYAGDGTIFLDEIGDLHPSMQIKLLRVLQDKELVRIGGLTQIPVNARVIAATNKKLLEEVTSGNFRRDLYYRLQLISINIPPLRERKSDIEPLINYFLVKSSRELGKCIQGIETTAVLQLMEHDWPGNVRELENLIKRAVIVARGETIGLSLIREIGFRPTSGSKNQMNPVESTVRKWFLQRRQMPFARDAFHKELIAAVEKTLIQESLLASDFNQVRAARLLGMNRTTLRKKMEEYGLKSVG